VAVDAHRARQRAELRARAHQLDAERQIRRGQPVGRAGADRDVAIVEPGRQLRDADPGDLLAELGDAVLERRGREPDRQRAQPGAPALEPLGRRGARIGAEVADLELELVDGDEPDGQVTEHEPADASLGMEAERQAPRGGGSPGKH
jgi:hypothetical protein